MKMAIRFCSLFLALSLAFGTLALAQQPQTSTPTPTSQGKADTNKKRAKKSYRADDFGDLHDKAKKHGIDTSNPESLKGRDVGGEIAKTIKL